jgi:hypothetical protein
MTHLTPDHSVLKRKIGAAYQLGVNLVSISEFDIYSILAVELLGSRLQKSPLQVAAGFSLHRTGWKACATGVLLGS